MTPKTVVIYEDKNFLYHVFGTSHRGEDVPQASAKDLYKLGCCDIIDAEEVAYTFSRQGKDVVWVYPQDYPIYNNLVKQLGV